MKDKKTKEELRKELDLTSEARLQVVLAIFDKDPVVANVAKLYL